MLFRSCEPWIVEKTGLSVERHQQLTIEQHKAFGRRFGEPYPWAKYAQLAVWNFGSGGMENTSATTMMSSLLDKRRDEADDYISHELAHQWFGDSVAPYEWSDLWLNEGLASYGEALYYEMRPGSAGQATLTSYMNSQLKPLTIAVGGPLAGAGLDPRRARRRVARDGGNLLVHGERGRGRRE